ncbi:ABC transporter ATP-binding protein [Jeotgalibaca caeni]|uniref:ABC transporter ATP-binding protein n=1 Tax=Jeotgalibaca caeni TaxID=3028623 RepID=UPI00237E017A|nr:ABC transporter ATP-binding protein [Jeotgalibaca caeni]MDE1549454.1 ABC transporter ATP-binding protein [Jeotgalibaca caeni]
MIQFTDVSKEYTPGQPVVSGINLQINDGEFFVLIGPSGSGKTTTLKMINRLIPLTSGWIEVNGKPISDFNLQELRWNMGYVLQQIALFPNMTVEENILVVPEMKKWPKEKMRERVTELLTTVGLDPEQYRNREISALSGGEQQRIGVIRALAADPDIILMDEPFSALDPISRHQLRKDVTELQRKLQKTIVFVTHDMQEAIQLGDRICLMNHGKIEQIGTPQEILEQPKNDFVREFLQTGLPNYKEAVKIRHLVEAGFSQEATSGSSPILSMEESVETLVQLLSQRPIVSIQGAGEVTQQGLLAYLAQEGLEVAQ